MGDCFDITMAPGLSKIKEYEDDDDDDDESQDAVEQVTKALNWLRGSEAEQEDPVTQTLSAEEERAQEMEKALDWLKSNDMDYDNADLDDEDSVAAMSLISEVLPNAETKAAREVATAMENALDWLRSNDATQDLNVDEPSVSSFQSFKKHEDNLEGKAAKDERARDMEAAVDWLKGGEKTKGKSKGKTKEKSKEKSKE